VSSRRAATRDAILDAARSLFEARGYYAVGLEAVARKAGVSRQAIYLHFDSKAALVDALHTRINEHDVAPVIDRVWALPDASSALDQFVAASAAVIPRILAIANVLHAPRHVDPDAAATYRPPAQSRYDDCRRMAEWLDRDALLASGVAVRDAADVLWNMASIHSFESLVVDRGWSAKRWTRWVQRSVRRLLLEP
jgi:AcrR family transcriptional regulator